MDFLYHFSNQGEKISFLETRDLFGDGNFTKVIKESKEPLRWDGIDYYWDENYQHDVKNQKICFHDVFHSWNAALRNVEHFSFLLKLNYFFPALS